MRKIPMTNDPATYEALNPRNGWGDYTSCLDFLTRLHAACVEHDLTTVRIDR